MTTKGYNSQKHSSLPYVDKFYKDLLDKTSVAEGRSKKRQVEMSIENNFIQRFGFEEYKARKEASQYE